MGELEECKKCCEEVYVQAKKCNSPNCNFIAGKAKSVISGAYKQERDFSKAEEMLESSSEVCLCCSHVIAVINYGSHSQTMW